jgi:hypothetical protein
MPHTASRLFQWQKLGIVTAVLLGTAMSMIVMATGGCETDIILNNDPCPDAGSLDGGDAGQGEGGGSSGSRC